MKACVHKWTFKIRVTKIHKPLGFILFYFYYFLNSGIVKPFVNDIAILKKKKLKKNPISFRKFFEQKSLKKKEKRLEQIPNIFVNDKPKITSKINFSK